MATKVILLRNTKKINKTFSNFLTIAGAYNETLCNTFVKHLLQKNLALHFKDDSFVRYEHYDNEGYFSLNENQVSDAFDVSVKNMDMFNKRITSKAFYNFNRFLYNPISIETYNLLNLYIRRNCEKSNNIEKEILINFETKYYLYNDVLYGIDHSVCENVEFVQDLCDSACYFNDRFNLDIQSISVITPRDHAKRKYQIHLF